MPLLTEQWHTRRFRCVAALGIFAGGLLFAAGGCQTTTHQEHRQEAQRRWSEVRAKVKGQLARQQFEAGHAQEAINAANEALGLDPTDVECYVVLIRALLEDGDVAAAERAFQAARAQGLDSAELDYLYAVVAERSRKLSAALEFYRKARQADPTQVDYVVAEAECLVALGRAEEGRDLVLESVDHFQSDGTLDTLLAEIALMLGDQEAAADAFQRAMPFVGNDPVFTEEYGLLSAQLGRFAEAVSVLEPLVEGGADSQPSGAAVRALARCYLELGQLEAAASLIGRWLRDHSDDAGAWLLQGRAALARGDLRAARRSAEMAIRLEPRAAEAHLIYGYACWRQGELTQAEAALEQALAIDPDDALIHCLVGQVLADSGQPGRARDHWERALQLDPRSAWAHAGLDQHHLTPQDPDPLAGRS